MIWYKVFLQSAARE